MGNYFLINNDMNTLRDLLMFLTMTTQGNIETKRRAHGSAWGEEIQISHSF